MADCTKFETSDLEINASCSTQLICIDFPCLGTPQRTEKKKIPLAMQVAHRYRTARLLNNAADS